MTELDQVIAAAYTSQGKIEDVNKVYLTLLRATLFLPVKKGKPIDSEEAFSPLYAHIDEKYFMLVFDTIARLTEWAGDQFSEIDYVELSGKDLVAGINNEVFLILNLGAEIYKEFSPDEIKHLKKIVARIDQLKEP
ncbi:MAG: SseB family protein [Gammaproteobacteria bacterium]